jgi:hypothetical protein
MRPVCDFFALFSMRTWHELELVQKGAFRLDETTITQNFVKDFWVESKVFNFPIRLFESKNEKANGNDLEVLIETNTGYIMMPIQIKVIKENEKYIGISHKVQSVNQIDLLIDYANKKRGIAAYIFYNYYSDHNFREYASTISENVAYKHFGCTIGNAYNIRKAFYERDGKNTWKIPSFRDLHMPCKFAIPLHYALCKLIDCNYNGIKWFMGNHFKNRPPHFYKIEDLEEDNFWSEIFPPGRISGTSHAPEMGDIVELVTPQSSKIKRNSPISSHADHLFNPMYRIVISKHKKRVGLHSLS